MPPSLRDIKPDFTQRAHLTELMDEPCTRDEMRSCLRSIARINRYTFAYRPTLDYLNQILEAHPNTPTPLRILDAGSGYGDTLRRIAIWAEEKSIPVELIGIDLNADAAFIAAEATPPTAPIHWVTSDIFTYQPEKPVHIVLSALFTHHLTEPQIVQFLQWSEQNAQLGWFINDLSRALIPFHFIRIATRLARLHHFVQYDAPVSVARSFQPQDWQHMLAAANITQARIEPHTPARLCVARIK